MIKQNFFLYRPDNVSIPGETLLDLIEERGMTQVELAERTGRPLKTINEIINGKAAITSETAIQFERTLGTPYLLLKPFCQITVVVNPGPRVFQRLFKKRIVKSPERKISVAQFI